LASEAVVVKAANITTAAGAAAASHGGGGTRTRIDEKSRFVLKISYRFWMTFVFINRDFL
jgi:hypothetical protein